MNKPIFIFGSPRSGVTLLENILGIHPELAWLSEYNNLHPDNTKYSIINRLFSFPIVGSAIYEEAWKKEAIGSSYLPIPTEAWNFWRTLLPNFKKGVESMESSLPCANNMSDEEAIRIRKTIANVTRFQGKSRFFATYSDFPRIEYFSKAFPEALFIHLVRDGRAVSESYFRVNELGYYNSWDERKAWFKKMPKSWRDSFYNEHYNIFSFSVYRWMYYLKLFREESSKFPTNRILQIAFEDIVKDPIKSIKMIQDFANLSYSSKMERYLIKIPPINNNIKWRKALSNVQLDIFFQIVKEKCYLDLLRDDI